MGKYTNMTSKLWSALLENWTEIKKKLLYYYRSQETSDLALDMQEILK